jgi:hypothetical protein
MLFSAQTGQWEDALQIEYEYEFNSLSGCYLAGRWEIRQMVSAGLLDDMPPGVELNFECTEQRID